MDINSSNVLLYFFSYYIDFNSRYRRVDICRTILNYLRNSGYYLHVWFKRVDLSGTRVDLFNSSFYVSFFVFLASYLTVSDRKFSNTLDFVHACFLIYYWCEAEILLDRYILKVQMTKKIKFIQLGSNMVVLFGK